MSADQPSYIASTPQDKLSNPSEINQQVSDLQPPEQNPSSIPSQDTPKTMLPNGYGLIHQNHIYGIYKDLGREYETLETKEQRREFLITKGENRGKVMLDTRCRAPDRT
jgi:hypothetical protein